MKNKLLTLLLLLLLATPAAAQTTHYSIPTPVVGGSQNTWGTTLNNALGSFDTFVWDASGGTTIGVNQPAAGSSNIVLTNPINNYQALGFTTTGKHVALPAMNATQSPVIGGTLWFYNSGSNPYEITAADGTTAVVTTLTASQAVQVTPLTNSTTNGTWQVAGPYLTSVPASTLGASVSAAFPANAAAANTGFYSTTTSNVGVTILGTSEGLWNASGYNGVIGATTPAAGTFTTLSSSSAAITGGTINGTSIGATTSSTGTFTTATATNLVAGGNTYPATAGTNKQFAQTNGSGTVSWASPATVYIGGTIGSTLAQGSTNYMWLGSSPTEANIYTVLPSGTLKTLTVVASGNMPAGQSALLTLRKAASDTAITCTIIATANACSDLSHTVISAGEVYDISVVTSATSGALTYNFSIEETIP